MKKLLLAFLLLLCPPLLGQTLPAIGAGDTPGILESGADADSTTVQSDSGLEIITGLLTLLRGCADNEILKWDETADDWNCEADADTGGAFSDASDPIVQNTITKDVHIGDGAGTLVGKLEVGGDADQPQLVVEGFSTQTDSLAVFQNDADAEVATVDVTGLISTLVGLDAIGAVNLDYGSADVTDHTFTTDSTGTAEIVLPAGAIDSTEILDSTIVAADVGSFTSAESLAILSDETGTGLSVFNINPSLTGATLTAELFVDATGAEFEAGDALTDCSTYGATNGGIFFDDSEGILKKCEDNVLTDLDTVGGGAFSDASDPIVQNTITKDVHIGDGAGTLSGKLEIGGDADQPQLVIESHSTQTDDVFIIQQDDDTEVFSISDAGVLTSGSGAVQFLNGLASITSGKFKIDSGTPTPTNPVFIADGADVSTGIGGGQTQISLIISSDSGVFITETSDIITTQFDAGDNQAGNVGAWTNMVSAIATVNSSAAATLTASSLIPDGAMLIGLTAHITTGFGTSTGLTDFDVGDGSDVDRWANSLAITATTTMDPTDSTADAGGWFQSATDVVLTAVGGNFDATGTIELLVHYISLTAPTG